MKDKTTRIDFDTYAMALCHTVALRSTCRHRDQGAVIFRDKRVASCGYNGAPPGQADCLELGYCGKDEGLPCRAEGQHGESNAIINAARNGICTVGCVMYCVYSPCVVCCNMIKTAGITTLYYEEVYSGFPDGPEYLKTLGVEVINIKREVKNVRRASR